MKYILSSVLVISSLFCRAQSYLLKESEVTEKDCSHMYFRQQGGRFADLRCSFDGKGDPVTLRVYDGALKQLSSHEFGEIGDKEFHNGLSDGRQLLLGFADRKKNVYAYSVNPADGQTKLIGQLTDDDAKEFMVRTGFSPDSTRSFFVVRFQQKGSSVYKGLILDKQFGIADRISVSVDESDGPVEEISYALANEGTFSIVNATGSSTKEPYIPLVYSVTQVSAGKVSRGKLTGLPEGLFDKVLWEASGSDLSFTGFLGIDRKSGFTSIVSGIYRAQQPVAEMKEYTLTESIPYSAGLLTTHRDKNNLLTVILLEGERERWKRSGNWTMSRSKYCAEAIAPEVPSAPPTSRGTPYYGNCTAHIVRFKAKGSLDWVRSIQKNQVELGGTIYTGLVPLFTADGGVKLFFQDARENRQPAGTKFTRAMLPGRKKEGLACVTILPDGKPAKKEFLDTFVENDPSGFFFSPYDAISYGTDKIIFTWYDKHGMGRSEYRVGSIAVQ